MQICVCVYGKYQNTMINRESILPAITRKITFDGMFCECSASMLNMLLGLWQTSLGWMPSVNFRFKVISRSMVKQVHLEKCSMACFH